MSDEQQQKQQEKPAEVKDATPRRDTEESHRTDDTKLQNTSEGSATCSDAEFDGDEAIFTASTPEIERICKRAQAKTAAKIKKSKLQLFPIRPDSPPRPLIVTTTRTPAIIVNRNNSPSRASLYKGQETEEEIVKLKFYGFKQINDSKEMFNRLA